MNKTQNGVTGHTPTVNERLADLARRFDQGEFRGPGEYLIQVTKVCSGTEQVWGGQLLGWTTRAEVNALDKSIETDY